MEVEGEVEWPKSVELKSRQPTVAQLRPLQDAIHQKQQAEKAQAIERQQRQHASARNYGKPGAWLPFIRAAMHARNDAGASGSGEGRCVCCA